jgi:hypothetical protein
MKHQRPLAFQLLDAYNSGTSVAALAADTGLSEQMIVVRLSMASHVLGECDFVPLDSEGGLGVHWEYVCWKA